MVSHSLSELKEAYASRLRKEGQSVSVDVLIGRSADDDQMPQSTVDILTDHEIIFCTLALDNRSAIALKSKLTFYGRLSPSWQKVALTQKIIDANAANLLAEANIKLVVMSAAATEAVRKAAAVKKTDPQQSLLTSSEQAAPKKVAEKVPYRYPALNSIQDNDDDIYAVVIAFTSIILIGMTGVYFSWEKINQNEGPQSSTQLSQPLIMKIENHTAF